MPKTVVLLSGGMDSSTLAYKVAREDEEPPFCLSIDYAQRHSKELQAAKAIAETLGAELRVLDIRRWGALLASLDADSALVNPDVDVPHGHYADETMRRTVVPSRNAVLLSLGWSVATAVGARRLATAVHAGDHPIYPDCRPEFVSALNDALALGTQGYAPEELRLDAPFVHLKKEEIAALGAELGVPYELTWSCYEGGELHCGRCGTCVERKEAFALAGVDDPTEYAV